MREAASRLLTCLGRTDKCMHMYTIPCDPNSNTQTQRARVYSRKAECVAIATPSYTPPRPTRTPSTIGTATSSQPRTLVTVGAKGEARASRTTELWILA